MKIRPPHLRYMTEPEGADAGQGGATPPADTGAQVTDPPELGDAGKKAINAMKAERDEAKRLAAEAQAQLAEINRANETALEKAQREAQEATEGAKTATVSAFREAAVKFGGITAEDAELFLTGSDVETLTKQAARLADRTSNTPKPDLSQGGKPTPTGTPEADFASFLRGQLS